MKKLMTLSILFSLCLSFVPTQSNAQFGNVLKKAKKKAKDKLNKKDKGSTSTTRDNDIAKPYPEKPSPKTSDVDSQTEKEVTYCANFCNENKTYQTAPLRSFTQTAILSIVNDFSAVGYIGKSGYNHTTHIDGHADEAIYVTSLKNSDLFNRATNKWKEYKNMVIEKTYKKTDELYEEATADRNLDAIDYCHTGNISSSNVYVHMVHKINVLKQIFPQDATELEDLKNYIENRSKSLLGNYEEELDAVAINDVHKANLNKVIFTSNPKIDPQTAPASTYKTTFLPGEEVFAVVMLDKGINDDLAHSTRAEYDLLDGPAEGPGYVRLDAMIAEYQMFPIKDNQQYYIFPIIVNADKFKCWDTDTPQTDRGMMKIGSRGPRKHTFGIHLKDYDAFTSKPDVDLLGTFIIDGTKGDMGKIKQMAFGIKDKCNRE